ncbi:AraC family transcriptional regulator [Enterobacterales bacterium CwR94]|nr:AraC family transcriptional regulator [Enterobacterales bacterium CwR94]
MHTFLIIAPEGGMLLEATGIADILTQANRLYAGASVQPLYQLQLATTQPHHVITGASGLRVLADCLLGDLNPKQPRDTIMVVGRGLTEAEGESIANWLTLAAPHARRVVSVCGGALLLAQAGLLEGRRATTHWRLLDTLATRFPQVTVERGPIWVQDAQYWTSAGVSAGFDLTLALVEADYGFELARAVAQDMVMFLRRPGGQSQFSRYLLTQAKSPGPIRDLQAWMLEHLASDLSVERLAERVAMSPRNFTRVFTRETGTTPARYVEELRLDMARQHLEQSSENVERIAELSGFGSGLNLRRVFERALHLTPREYRQRFHARHLA